MKKMNIEKKLTIFIGITILMLISFSSFNLGLSDTIPVIEVEELSDNFIPNNYGDNDYYIVNPGEELALDTTYLGESTTIDYTDAATSFFSILSTSVNNEDTLDPSNSLLFGDERTYPQPFLDGSEEVPRAVKIDEIANASFEMAYQEPISLHIDYSFTFYADPAEMYYGMIETENPFYFDVFLHDCDAEAMVGFQSASPSLNFIDEKATSLPMFPYNDTIQKFLFVVDNPTLVTLTPHNLKPYLIDLELGEAQVEQVIQGSLDVDDKDYDLVTNKTNIFSLYTYELAIEKDQYYEIFFNMIDFMNIESCDPDITTLIASNTSHYTSISGSLDEDGYRFKAEETTELTLVVVCVGVADLQYTIYFKEYDYDSGITTTDLQLNTNIVLDINTYYEFDLAQPTLMAINSTLAGDFDVDFYRGDGNGTWTFLTNDNFFNIETGNLVGDAVNDIGTGATWRYIPAGNYAIRSFDETDEEIQFNTVSIGTFSSSVNFNINQDNYAAYELPLTVNRYNFINISTTTQKNESVTLEYTIVNKYNDGISSGVNNLDLGNEKSSGIWESFPLNDTVITGFIPTRPNDVPILIIRAYEAQNLTLPIDSFSIGLTLSSNVISNYYPFINLGYIGSGAFLPQSPISSTTIYSVNEDKTTDNDQIYAIPLNVDPNSLYNITIRLIGNYTSTDDLNMTFGATYAATSNLKTGFVFGATDKAGQTERNRSILLLTVTDTAYLFVDLQRINSGGYLNGTLRIEFTKIPANSLSFDVDLSIHEWNEDRLDGEEKNSVLLFDWLNKRKSAPGFELLALITTMTALSVLYSKKRK